ncbi:hypothetical protein [Ornithinimicrobium sp. INDO-MA30-4]|uniref:hypothetical protein n=1 Tax=Ornithinimicrobium sp. INDO-MA30-4 TaxID=2908651 RepID=UPI001F2E37D3|nr:hypothetical protein [Ornithinimicrobium sp. INDO-MA30-4]UJH71338.1 hypothetical protein L0A91_06180 [Ornithinimicrobium sp. INDO-MA30-4]
MISALAKIDLAHLKQELAITEREEFGHGDQGNTVTVTARGLDCLFDATLHCR